MKKMWVVTYTDWVKGGYNGGQPLFGQTKVIEDRQAMLRFLKARYDERGGYRWEPPTVNEYELVTENLYTPNLLAELETIEKTKNFGEGI